MGSRRAASRRTQLLIRITVSALVRAAFACDVSKGRRSGGIIAQIRRTQGVREVFSAARSGTQNSEQNQDLNLGQKQRLHLRHT